MEEGYNTLKNLYQATEEAYRKQIKIMIDNLERETQKSVIFQWKILRLKKNHDHWVKEIKADIEATVKLIENSEKRRIELLQKTLSQRKEIDEFVAKMEKLTVELQQEEEEFTLKEKLLIAELSKYEELYIQEAQIHKEKQEELIECIPQLQKAEEEYEIQHKKLEKLYNVFTGTHEVFGN